jgi:hypothetical protein
MFFKKKLKFFLEQARPDPKRNWAEISKKKYKLSYVGLDSAQPRGLG